MGKLINMMQSNLFGRKKVLENHTTTSVVEIEESNNRRAINNTHGSCSIPAVSFTVDIKKDRKETLTDVEHVTQALGTVIRDGISVDRLANGGGSDIEEKPVNIKKIVEGCNKEHLDEKLYELERCYLFEQNTTIDRYESEKVEMLAKHAEEKVLVKRAYEHDKDEILKEMERKDKMLFELTAIMKEECTSKLQKQKQKYEKMISEKENLFFNSSIEEKLRDLVENLQNFFKNNQALTECDQALTECVADKNNQTLTECVADKNNHAFTECVADFQLFLSEYQLFLESVAAFKTSNESKLSGNMKTETESFSSLPRRLERLAREPTLPTDNRQLTEYDNVPLNLKRKAANSSKVVTRTLSDNIGLKTDCCRKHSNENSPYDNSDEAVQQELAQAYRKQKTELLKLFNSEKEEFERASNKDKDNFERETRAEYVKRMEVERKAWQETIEDYEREISILKYERQQMDTNYCISMDKMNTEFEREKNLIHRRYSESCSQMKKDMETLERRLRITESSHSEKQLCLNSVK